MKVNWGNTILGFWILFVIMLMFIYIITQIIAPKTYYVTCEYDRYEFDNRELARKFLNECLEKFDNYLLNDFNFINGEYIVSKNG